MWKNCVETCMLYNMIELCMSLIRIYVEHVILVMGLVVIWVRREVRKLKKKIWNWYFRTMLKMFGIDWKILNGCFGFFYVWPKYIWRWRIWKFDLVM
jgi:hypothetical protein